MPTRFFSRSSIMALLFLTAVTVTFPLLSGCDLGHPDRQDNLNALARWEDQRLAPQDSLVTMLRHHDAHIRLAAVRCAGLIGRSDVLPEMIETLEDRSLTVVRQACFSLGVLGDDDAVEELERMAQSPQPGTRVAALRGLAHLDHDGQAFLDACSSSDPDEAAAAWDGLRNVAARADSTALHEALMAGLDRTQTDILWRVLRCTERTSWPNLIGPISEHIPSSQPQVLVHALRALSAMKDEAALGAVVSFSRHQHKFQDRHRSRVEIALLRALGQLGHHNFSLAEAGEGEKRDFLVTALISGAGHSDSHVAITALAAMENTVSDLPLPVEATSQESLLPVWRIRLARAAHSHLDHPVTPVRAAAIRAWALLRGGGAADHLQKLEFDDNPPEIVAALLFSLGRIHPEPMSILNQYTTKTSPAPALVRTAALEATVHVFQERSQILPFGMGPEYAMNRLITASLEKDFVVATTAADLLGAFPHRHCLSALAGLWDRAPEQPADQADLQLAVLGAIRAMGPDVLSLERADTTGTDPDNLLVVTRKMLRESFDSRDIRIRYRGRTAAVETGLLPDRLIPSEASLLATLPAHARSPRQTALTLPFNAPKIRCVTKAGEFIIQLDGEIAPNTCANFVALIEQGFYEDLKFHRVVPDFVVQGGCPRGDGWGGPGYTIRSEWSRARYQRAAVGIAHSGKDTGGSQFFVTLSEQPHLNGRYTIFGEVVKGMDVVDRINAGDRFHLEIVD